MSWAPGVLLPLLALAAVYLLTSRFRRYALSRLVDVPNPRSSHVVPTPRGGGAAIVVVSLLALPLLAGMGAVSWWTTWGLLGAGTLVAIVGFADDHSHIPAKWRLFAHFMAAVWLVGWLGGLPPLSLLGSVIPLGWLGVLLAILYVVWLLNLSNFMDGIDGIAAVEVITVSLSGAILYVVASPGDTHWLTPAVIAGATMGFLIWNWPPARIFMGDVGSGFLGLLLAGLSLDAGWVAPRLFWAWVILLGVFVVDATVTLIRRTARGDRFYEAHRTHAYQHAAALWGAHLPVTVATGLITLAWLLPLAILVTVGRLDGISGVLIGYAPLVIAALWLNAGKPTG